MGQSGPLRSDISAAWQYISLLQKCRKNEQRF